MGPYRITALRVAAQRGHLEIVKILVNRGAKTDIIAADGLSLLQITLVENQVDVYRYLKGILHENI